jgi:UDP-glucose 4-epimerase
MKARILVTGGTGYIGSHTVVELIAQGYEVLIIDDLSNSSLEVLDGIEQICGQKPAFFRLDLKDRAALEVFFREQPIEAVIHFAASKKVGESVALPLLYYRNNLLGLINLLELMIAYYVNNLVFSSSCTVYGEPDSLPVSEAAPIKPATSPYGRTKRMAEEIISDTVTASPDLRAIALRYFNPIGAHASALIGELPLGQPDCLVPYITQTGIGLRESLTVHGDDYDTPDGTCIRDYIHVSDLARAHISALERLFGQSGEAMEYFNIGTGQGYSVKEVIATFEKVSGRPLAHQIGPRRPGDIVAVYADPHLAEEKLAWRAKAGLEEMLETAWAWERYYRSGKKDGI